MVIDDALEALSPGVRDVAISVARGVLTEAESIKELPEPSDMAADGLGGLEVSWKKNKRMVLFSVAASREDLPPDSYLILVDWNKERDDDRYKTVDDNLPAAIVAGIDWINE